MTPEAAASTSGIVVEDTCEGGLGKIRSDSRRPFITGTERSRARVRGQTTKGSLSPVDWRTSFDSLDSLDALS